MQEVSVRASVVSQEKGDHIPWGWVAITAVGLVVAVTLAAFVWVGIYSYLIHPGEELAYYQNYAQFSSPIVSVVVGIPVWFFACRWATGNGTRAVSVCLWAWLIVPVLHTTESAGKQRPTSGLVSISDSPKLMRYLGGVRR